MGSSTPELIETGVKRFIAEVPALENLKLVFHLELHGRGDVQIFRVELPGPKISKLVPEDARVQVSLPRSDFNELATKGGISDYREALETGHLKVSGDPRILKLVGTVVERHEARAKLRKAKH